MLIIYKITNKVNGKPYIGYTKTSIIDRWKKHIQKLKAGTNRKLYDAMRKYGVENFSIEEIDSDQTNNIKEWLELETLYIIIYDSVDSGYNMTYGGIGGNVSGGKSMKGKTCYDKWVREFGKEEADKRKQEATRKRTESIRTLRLTQPYPKLSAERKGEISETNKRLGIKPPLHIVYGEDHQFYGKTHTKEAKKKISEARIGKTYEECMPIETAKKLRELHRNQFLGENNPNYVDIPEKELHSLIISGKTNKEISDYYETSKQTIIAKSKLYFDKTPSQLKDEHNDKT